MTRWVKKRIEPGSSVSPVNRSQSSVVTDTQTHPRRIQPLLLPHNTLPRVRHAGISVTTNEDSRATGHSGVRTSAGRGEISKHEKILSDLEPLDIEHHRDNAKILSGGKESSDSSVSKASNEERDGRKASDLVFCLPGDRATEGWQLHTDNKQLEELAFET